MLKKYPLMQLYSLSWGVKFRSNVHMQRNWYSSAKYMFWLTISISKRTTDLHMTNKGREARILPLRSELCSKHTKQPPCRSDEHRRTMKEPILLIVGYFVHGYTHTDRFESWLPATVSSKTASTPVRVCWNTRGCGTERLVRSEGRIKSNTRGPWSKSAPECRQPETAMVQLPARQWPKAYNQDNTKVSLSDPPKAHI